MKNEKKYVPSICLDFDGVCNTYNGWKGQDELFQPRDRLKIFLQTLNSAGFKIFVLSTRPAKKIEEWFRIYEMDHLVTCTDKKPASIVYLDDRAIRFDGVFSDRLIEKLTNFKAHWEKS